MRKEPLSIFISFPTKPLTDWLPSGDGLVAYQIIAGLAERGHRLHVATPYADIQSPFSSRVTVYQMDAQKGQSRRGAITYMWWTRRMLRSVRATTQVDLIHELNPVLSFRSLAFTGTGIPVVLGPHSSRWPINSDESHSLLGASQRRIKHLLKNTCVNRQHRCAKAVLLSTHAALNNVSQPERILDRLFLLPPGIDDQKFVPGQTASSGPPTILFLANVVVRKGIYSLLDAFDTLSKRMPAVHLIIAGDGPALPAVKEKVSASHYRNRVQFLGRIDRADIPNLLRQCTIYCLPSHGEPFGMTALEAMACGKPLVVTNAGGPGYMVSEQGGRSVPVNNPTALAHALDELFSDPELCRKMGEHNRAQIEAQYSWPIVINRLENIYREVLGDNSQINPDRITIADIAEYRRRNELNVTPEGNSQSWIQAKERAARA
jgi:glycosyltransferase involved in cell wall biosynthesis